MKSGKFSGCLAGEQRRTNSATKWASDVIELSRHDATVIVAEVAAKADHMRSRIQRWRDNLPPETATPEQLEFFVRVVAYEIQLEDRWMRESCLEDKGAPWCDPWRRWRGDNTPAADHFDAMTQSNEPGYRMTAEGVQAAASEAIESLEIEVNRLRAQVAELTRSKGQA